MPDSADQVAPAPNDRIFRRLLELAAADALEKVAVWLEDCASHVELGRPGGLPTPAFDLNDAWIVVRLAAGRPARVDIPHLVLADGAPLPFPEAD